MRRLGLVLGVVACSPGEADTEAMSTSLGPATAMVETSMDPGPTTSTSSSDGSTEAGSTASSSDGPTTGGCAGMVCGGVCVDVMSDEAHCGGCEQACAPGEVCTAGDCVPQCDEGTVLCAGACVDTNFDAAYCGGCDVACDAGDPCVQADCDSIDVVHLLITGQSLSNGYGSAVLSTMQPHGNLSFNTGVRAGAMGLTGFIPLVEAWDGAHGETIASGMANLAGNLWAAAGFDARTFLVSAHGVDGFNYSKVKKGTPAYTTGMAQVAAGLALATALGQTYEVRAMTAVHGESDHIDYPPEGNTSYAANLLEWRADYEADIQAMTGQTTPVRFFYCQVSSWTAYGSTHSLIPEQQRRAALENPDRLYLVTPKYFLQYTDGVHLTGEGTLLLGEYYGKALRRVYLDGLPWAPLGPTGAIVDGVDVVVDFAVPAPPLVFDEVAVTNPGNYGFAFSDASGNPPAISAVALTGPAQVTVTLSGPPGPQARLFYAALGQPGAAGGPTTGPRGNLRDSDATPSLAGQPLYNWAVHFELPLN